ncbi:hypothetical protein [Nocardioides sp. LHG3406-4]|uniref:hypothetical protein n=1 Tax=Nocardioides sp. LHG3406-4 TaxID=2804575 RepID=UPI003CF0C369
MNDLTAALLRGYLCLHAAVTAPRERDERGDVPGWVMITVMTAAIVAGLITVAGPQLKEMLVNALNSVK